MQGKKVNTVVSTCISTSLCLVSSFKVPIVIAMWILKEKDEDVEDKEVRFGGLGEKKRGEV